MELKTKSSADYIKGILLILVAVVTFILVGKKEFNWDYVFNDRVGKLSNLLGIFYLLFGHIYGAITGVLVGLWLIFRR